MMVNLSFAIVIMFDGQYLSQLELNSRPVFVFSAGRPDYTCRTNILHTGMY